MYIPEMPADNNCISRLKNKLGRMDGSDEAYIDTIRGVGYRWREH